VLRSVTVVAAEWVVWVVSVLGVGLAVAELLDVRASRL
jgi:hypothetical protein